MQLVTFFWITVALIYLGLWLSHVIFSRSFFHPFPNHHGIAKISGVSTGLVELTNDINNFTEELNKYNNKMNTVQFWSYLAAFIAAVLGVFSSL